MYWYTPTKSITNPYHISKNLYILCLFDVFFLPNAATETPAESYALLHILHKFHGLDYT